MILVYVFNINILVVKHLLKNFSKIVCDLSVGGYDMSSQQLFCHF